MQNLWFTVSSNCNQTTLQLWSVSPKVTFLHHFLSISCTMNYSNLVPAAPNQVKFCLQSHQGAKWDSTPAGPLTRPRPSASYLITGGSHAAAESTNTKLNPAQDTFRIQMWTKTTWFIFPWALLPHSMITPLVPLSSLCLLTVSAGSLRFPGTDGVLAVFFFFFFWSLLQSLRLKRVRNTWTRTQHQQRNTKTERKERWIECHGSKVLTLSLFSSFHMTFTAENRNKIILLIKSVPKQVLCFCWNFYQIKISLQIYDSLYNQLNTDMGLKTEPPYQTVNLQLDNSL